MHHSRAGPAPSGAPRLRHVKMAARAGRSRPGGPIEFPFWNRGHTDLKLHQDTSGALNTITGYGPDYVDINLERHEQSVIVLPGAPVQAWPVSSFDALAPEHFAVLLEQAPEVVIFGSGARLRFPHPRLLAALAARRIGVETMDFQAACRTYNILMAEGRKVAAALLIER